jgi:hypothetical protein
MMYREQQDFLHAILTEGEGCYLVYCENYCTLSSHFRMMAEALKNQKGIRDDIVAVRSSLRIEIVTRVGAVYITQFIVFSHRPEQLRGLRIQGALIIEPYDVQSAILIRTRFNSYTPAVADPKLGLWKRFLNWVFCR